VETLQYDRIIGRIVVKAEQSRLVRSLRAFHWCELPVLFGKSRDPKMPVDLTPRQREVVRLLSLGCSIYEAAKILGLAPSTIDNTKTAAMARLGTNKLALVTRLAIKHRISSLRDKLTRTEKRKSGRRKDGWN